MINATISIPTLHCVEQSDGTGKSEPYLWFCFFWSDATSNPQEPVSVRLSGVYNERDQYPDNVGNNQDIPIPYISGTSSAALQPPGMLGVLVALLEQDETPENAIAAGAWAFRGAVHRELNKFVLTNGFRKPTPPEMEVIQHAIEGSFKAAIRSKLSWVSKWFDDQDDFIGFSHAIFTDFPLLANQPFDLPGINRGHDRYGFVGENLTVKKVRPGFPATILDLFGKELETAKDLRQRSRKLKEDLSRAAEAEKPAIREKLRGLRHAIAQADQTVETARWELANSSSRHAEPEG